MDIKQEKIRFKLLTTEEINDDLLSGFERYQETKKVWIIKDGNKQLIDFAYTDDWDAEDLAEITEELQSISKEKGYVIVIDYDGITIGFAALAGQTLKEHSDYLQLIQMQVSKAYRGMGYGKLLFKKCVELARKMAVTKLYISGHPSFESQAFYTNLGCVDAKWLCQELVELEPYDIHLEYEL